LKIDQQNDCVLIFSIKNNEDILRFGYAKNEEKDLIIQ
jgi:mRNA-degrading endonuclease YafQ of YafQ-DinJ toxin-antitoxin module